LARRKRLGIGEWGMENEEWRLENGEWRMENGEWRFKKTTDRQV
jgi:hypothetical protein